MRGQACHWGTGTYGVGVRDAVRAGERDEEDAARDRRLVQPANQGKSGFLSTRLQKTN